MKRALVTLTACAGFLTAASAYATENGSPTTPMGVYEFGSGFLPPATPYGTFGLRTSYYTTDNLRDASGNRADNDVSIDVLSIGLAYIHMTDQTLFGGRYGFSGVMPFTRMNAELDVNVNGTTVFSDSASVFRQADLQVTPLILAWNPAPNMGVTAQFQVQAPTGDYDKDRLINPGVNHWAFSPIFGFSYITDTGLEFSTLSQFDINTENPDTDYRSGIEYKNEFAIGQHVDSYTVGLGGYYYHQITDDKGDADTIYDGNRARVWALGPAVSFFKPGLPTVWFHAYKEFGARNRAEGYNVALRIAHSF
ncbi:SphA family protein [Larsenimonas suaedae]|uniref:Transporter n=1 Tax=Larsenimonas suaedae TaxID=1851019 RepID=A0ABU1GWH3_9GAMM|nr:transporter [Larsenimonas suaedae]MCM2972921.1 transporter [Larsenimonas suaedae]MDR5896358.1 transporter [Larsenimonas suaedae]